MRNKRGRQRRYEKTEGGTELQKDNGVLCVNVQIGLHKGLLGTISFYKGNNMANKNSQVEDVRETLSGYIKFRFDIYKGREIGCSIKLYCILSEYVREWFMLHVKYIFQKIPITYIEE